MGFLKRILGGGDKGPDWAPFMTGAEYAAFEPLVIADLTARGYAVEVIPDGGVKADLGGGNGENPVIYGLYNLAQVCHQADRSAWPQIIHTHFSQIAASAAMQEQPFDLETVRPLLRVRLYRVSDTPPEAVAFMVKTEFAPDLIAALVIDLPTTVRTTNHEEVEAWAIPVEELFRIAAQNLAGEVSTYERSRLPMRDGHSLEMWAGNTFFVSSQAYRFAQIVGQVANGALIVMPNRHQLAWHAIESAAGTVLAVQALVQIAGTGYREGPGSLSPDLYWWREGVFTRLPATIDRKGLQFAPPDEFVELLNSLA